MFSTRQYRTARAPHKESCAYPPLSISRLILARALRRQGHRVTSSVAKLVGGQILTMQRLIVALCLSAAAALVPNSAAARSNSNAKAPLKVG